MSARRYREFFFSQPAPGVRLFALPTDRFKTVSVRAFLCEPLRKFDATSNALLSYVLRAGSEDHPSRRDIARACEELWGATAGTGVTRFGDVQAVTAGAEFPADRFLPPRARELDGVLALLSGMLLRPALDPSRSALRADIVAQESSQLHNDLVGQRDDKPSWAAWLAAQRVYAGTPGAIHDQGNLDDLPAITPTSLFERHRLLIRNAQVFLFVTGPVTPVQGLAALARHFKFSRDARPKLPAGAPLPGRARIQRVSVAEQSEQAHLISAWMMKATLKLRA
jgi:predicted Zn-dependent peptidase